VLADIANEAIDSWPGEPRSVRGVFNGRVPVNGRKKRRAVVLSVLIVVLVVLAHQMLFGKLFPYSPVKVGF
jgi:hypothetical protein